MNSLSYLADDVIIRHHVAWSVPERLRMCGVCFAFVGGWRIRSEPQAEIFAAEVNERVKRKRSRREEQKRKDREEGERKEKRKRREEEA